MGFWNTVGQVAAGLIDAGLIDVVVENILVNQKYPVLLDAIESYSSKGWTLQTSTQFTAQFIKEGVFSTTSATLCTDDNGNVTATESGLFGNSYIYQRPLNLEKPEKWLQNIQRKQLNSTNEITMQTHEEYDVFMTSLLQMMAKIARVGGVISKNKIGVLENMFQEWGLNVDDKKTAIQIFNTAKNSTTSIEEMAEICLKGSPDKEELSDLIELLFVIAESDGAVGNIEERMIYKVAQIVHLSGVEYELIKNKYTIAADLDAYYLTLECTRQDSDETIKKNYRRLAAEYHPDKIVYLKLPKDYEKFAHQKFIAIQEAFESIKKERVNL